MHKKLFYKISAIFILFSLLSTSLFAVDLNSFIELAQSGNISEIEAAFKENPELKNQNFGDNKESFLIIALKNNRPLDIISLLVKYGCKVKAKTKDKRTTIMFAAKFNSDPDVLRLLIKECALTNSGRIKFVNQADASGMTAFDYAKENANSITIESVLKEYKDNSDLDKEEKAKQKEELKAEKARQKEEAKAAKEAEKAAKEEEKAKQKEAEKAAKEEAKAAKEEAKAAKEEEKARQKEEAKAAKKAEKAAKEAEPSAEKPEETAPAEQKQEPAKESKPAVQYQEDDFFKNDFNADDFINSQDPDQEQTPSKPAAAPRNNRPANKPKPEQEQPLEKDRLSMKDGLTPQPYTKSYLFDYITDTTPETPAEDNTQPASIQIENVDRQDRNGITLLMKAAKAGNDWDVQNLLANGANVQLRDREGWSALMYAVRYQNNLSTVTKLIEAGAHVRVRNKVNTTPLLLAANYTQNPEILKLLLKDRTVSEDEVYAAFILALTSTEGAEHVKISKIKIFLEMGVSVNRMWKGKTPLMYACQYGDSTKVLKLLIDSGAKTSIQNQDGKTAFDYASANSSLTHDDIYWSINSIGR